MNWKSITSLLLLFLSGCAAYKELSPKPELLPFEQGYIELKNDKDNFKLDKGEKYFMKFPGPGQGNFYLVLRTKIKPILGSTLATAFDNGARPDARVADEMPGNDSLLVYPLDIRVQTYYWVIDTVRFDAELVMKYRYVPRWRFTFENKFATLRDLLAGNRVDPATYNAVGPGFDFGSIDCQRELGNLDSRTENLNKVKSDLQDLTRLFPPDIASRRDTAYDNYLLLQSELNAEMTLQNNYSTLLRVVDRDRATRGNPAAFMNAAPVFMSFFATRDRQRLPVVERVQSLLRDRLPAAESYYGGLLRSKTDFGEFAPKPPIETLVKLYEACEAQPSPGFRSMVAFVARYNVESGALQTARSKLNDIERLAQKDAAWESDALYTDLIARTSEVKAALPESQMSRLEGGSTYACAGALTREITRVSTEATALQMLYQRAAAAAAQLRLNSWGATESQLRDLSASTEYNVAPAAVAQQAMIASRLDASLFSRVKEETQRRLDAFTARNEGAIDNIPALYSDSSFAPVYRLTFSTGGAGELADRRKEIDDYIAQIRHVRFPAGAIRLLYGGFIRNPADRGVERARAIVAHGKEYTGGDKEIVAMVSECDPTVAKWISKPKEYRKVYALPVTSETRGKNEYMFRIRLQIPSEAAFPVFDVNIKLPREVAEKAGKEQWYSSITINKTPIRNEGRFRITSPTADNNYESLITPVQMDKAGANVLEIRFPYSGFRVLEISAMAQVPIIRKN